MILKGNARCKKGREGHAQLGGCSHCTGENRARGVLYSRGSARRYRCYVWLIDLVMSERERGVGRRVPSEVEGERFGDIEQGEGKGTSGRS
jgi:hypothetical protein